MSIATATGPGKGLLWAAAGPAAVGLALGLTRGAQGPGLMAAALLPAVVGGVLALTAPALYITAAFAGVAPEPRVLFAHLQRALRDGGLIMAGLAPGLLFLTATTHSDQGAVFLGMATVALGALVGLRLLFGRLFPKDDEDARGFALFVPWSLVSLGIGAFMTRAVLLG